MTTSKFALIGLLCILSAAPRYAFGGALNWESAFPITAAPERVHFHAHYLDEYGRTHELDIWRDGDRHLRRRTDSAIDFYVERTLAGDPDFRVVDHEHHVIIHADQAAFNRIGHFANWLALAHVLDRPRGEFRINPLSARKGQHPVGACAWFHLQTRMASESDICWSQQWGLPLVIETTNNLGQHSILFSVDEVQAFNPDPSIFEVNDRKLIQIDLRSNGNVYD